MLRFAQHDHFRRGISSVANLNQPIQCPTRPARVDGRPSHFETSSYILGQPANDHRRARVEQHHVALRSLLAIEHPAQDTRIVVCIAAFECLG